MTPPYYFVICLGDYLVVLLPSLLMPQTMRISLSQNGPFRSSSAVLLDISPLF